MLYDTITSCASWNKESEDVPLDQLTSACNLEPDPWNYSSSSDELLEIWFWQAGEPGATLREAWGALRKPCGTLHNLAARSNNSGARSEKLGVRSENPGALTAGAAWASAVCPLDGCCRHAPHGGPSTAAVTTTFVDCCKLLLRGRWPCVF